MADQAIPPFPGELLLFFGPIGSLVPFSFPSSPYSNYSLHCFAGSIAASSLLVAAFHIFTHCAFALLASFSFPSFCFSSLIYRVTPSFPLPVLSRFDVHSVLRLFSVHFTDSLIALAFLPLQSLFLLIPYPISYPLSYFSF